MISERRWSPLEASQRYLFHLRQALEEVRPGACAHDTPVVLTVPASFDESARELTRQAAVSAGWGEVLLLEEPLAALYAWLDYHRDEWRTILQPGDLVLICDVGGGTTDLSLVAVDEEEGELRLERVAVGEHILLGGDNMDLAIAHTLRQELADRGEAIDDWQFLSLVHASRAAKETLLLDDSLIEVPISIASRSASLFATTLSTKISKERVLELLLEGYFPRCAATDVPQKAVSFGLREIGLEYAADPAVTRHIAAFLRQSARNVMSDPKLRSRYDAHRSEDGAMLLPTRVLFNGGVFRAPPFRRRILEICSAWSGGREIRELASAGLDTAVAHGAAVYGGLVRAGESVRVRAGIGRSYYVGLQRSTPAVPGIKPAVQALCIAPQGMEEGGERELSGHAFGAVVGEPVEFRLFHSASRAGDDIGAVVRDAERELSESVPVRAHLTPPEGIRAGEVLPVVLRSRVTELGVLELALRHRDGEARWLLQFSVRDRPERDPSEPAGAAL